MDAEFFLQEALNSDICPTGFEKIYNEFRQYQRLAWDALIAFAEVCDKNHVPYQLAYGSLLGAVRDGGQIPWDYDIDVFVPFEEKDNLINALVKDLNKQYYSYCPEVNPKCRHLFPRIAPVGYKSDMVHVDVFYLTGAPLEPEERKVFCEQIYDIDKKRFKQLVKIQDAPVTLKTILRRVLDKLLVIGFSANKSYREYSRLCLSYPAKESELCVDARSNAYGCVYPGKMLRKIMPLEISGNNFSIPVNYSEVLKITYGDYLEYPPLSNRINEVLTHWRLLNKYARAK